MGIEKNPNIGKNQLQYGSQGDSTAQLQKILNSYGYELDEDGIFGGKTRAAVRDFQTKNGLDVDGIVGSNTISALTGGKGLWDWDGNTTTSSTPSNTAIATPSNTATPMPSYTAPTYKESDTVTQAKNALDTQLANKPGEYESQWQTQLDDTINKILNREKFSYDLNGDALYQQYKDKYIKLGKLASGDAIGQASAMTGGYGNSYAQSVGQQAYQAQLDNLNDIVPELYQMALDKYNMEGQDLYNQYALLGEREDLDYGRYRDEMADWLTERDYLANRYDSERDYDYSKFADDRNFDYGQYRDAVADDQWQTAFEYQKDRDKVADNQWQDEYDLAAGKVAGTTAHEGHTEVVEGKKATPTENKISGVTTKDIKQMQALLGVGQDGIWGAKSTAAAGGLSLQEAYKAWKNGTLKKVETKTWKDFNQEDLEKNQKEYGGSYYSTVLNDLKGMKTSGKSNKEVNAYLQELRGNSLISQSEYQTLYNKYRDNNLG